MAHCFLFNAIAADWLGGYLEKQCRRHLYRLTHHYIMWQLDKEITSEFVPNTEFDFGTMHPRIIIL